MEISIYQACIQKRLKGQNSVFKSFTITCIGVSSFYSIPDPQAWLDSFSVFPIVEIVPKLNELLTLSSSTEKN